MRRWTIVRLKTLVRLFYCAPMPQSNGGCIGKSAFVFHYAGSEVRHLCMWGVRDEAQIFQETTASFRKKENLVLFDLPGLFWHVNSSGLEIKRWSLRELCWLNERFKVQGWKTYKVITVIQGLEWILTFETTQLSLTFIPWCLQVDVVVMLLGWTALTPF